MIQLFGLPRSGCTASSQVGAPDRQRVLLAGAIGRGTCSPSPQGGTYLMSICYVQPRGSGKSGQRQDASGMERYRQALWFEIPRNADSPRATNPHLGTALSRPPVSRAEAKVVHHRRRCPPPRPPTPALQAHLLLAVDGAPARPSFLPRLSPVSPRLRCASSGCSTCSRPRQSPPQSSSSRRRSPFAFEPPLHLSHPVSNCHGRRQPYISPYLVLPSYRIVFAFRIPMRLNLRVPGLQPQTQSRIPALALSTLTRATGPAEQTPSPRAPPSTNGSKHQPSRVLARNVLTSRTLRTATRFSRRDFPCLAHTQSPRSSGLLLRPASTASAA
ncbi:hypothetical protein JDV02_001798 [Purpureocillium takamizusanense]|uniref:Uncharacterized protein n=1 Tax=Purpureocillium takamizusanense TaxID=2060973 RepID=A0A9Q8QAE5_9HYPO|nr:uncharacterized protein JDV02_001798 [Purpureocillium takamizusanense]UNI15247.1 hypothetical protein JDV02_001798 [Purpureocillium takamizusanense]